MRKLYTLVIFGIIVSNVLCGLYVSTFEQDDCSDFEEVKFDSCRRLRPVDNNKICSLINNKCVSTYKNCEDYNDGNIQKDICESIIPENYITDKCVFSGNKCNTEQRFCSDFKVGAEPIINCEFLKAKDSKKRCLFFNDQCIEQYIHCEDYKENNKEICESILLYDLGETDIYNKCVLEGGKCITKERLCEDCIYSYGIHTFFCEGLKTSDNSKRCALVGSKCKEQYKQCEYYEGNNKEICESIEPYDEYEESSDYSSKCVLEEGKCIKKKKDSCSEYKPGDEYSCEGIQLKNSLKACVYYEDKCIETYKTCEDYIGNNKEECESIFPNNHKDGFNFINYRLKCIYENKKCITKTKSCSEHKFNGSIHRKTNWEICQDLKVSDENKYCFLSKGGCIESYLNCEDYNKNVEKDICESIIPENYEESKCIYDNENKLCKTVKKACSTFQADLLSDFCESYGFWTKKKCSYSSGKCSKKDDKSMQYIYFD